MLNIAKNKAKKLKLSCKLTLGDMRTSQLGKFDAVITIFNSIGHLTKADFRKALKNIHRNLKPGGIYIFDIFNLNYMREDKNITSLTIDQVLHEKNRMVRKIQYSTVDHKGILESHTTSIIQASPKSKQVTHRGSQTIQIYTASELKTILENCEFKLEHKYGIDGLRFSDKKTKHMLLVARKP